MALLGRLTRKLLQGECIKDHSDIPDLTGSRDSLNYPASRPSHRAAAVFDPPGPWPDASECPHTVLMVERLFSDETWFLDTAGSQYGFQDVLVPYQKYLDEKACRIINDLTTDNANEIKDLDYFSILPFMNISSAQKSHRKLERKNRLHFSAFVDNQDTEKLLSSADVQFKNGLDNCVRLLRFHTSPSGHYYRFCVSLRDFHCGRQELIRSAWLDTCPVWVRCCVSAPFLATSRSSTILAPGGLSREHKIN